MLYKTIRNLYEYIAVTIFCHFYLSINCKTHCFYFMCQKYLCQILLWILNLELKLFDVMDALFDAVTDFDLIPSFDFMPVAGKAVISGGIRAAIPAMLASKVISDIWFRHWYNPLRYLMFVFSVYLSLIMIFHFNHIEKTCCKVGWPTTWGTSTARI